MKIIEITKMLQKILSFPKNNCHPERSEGSLEISHFTPDDNFRMTLPQN